MALAGAGLAGYAIGNGSGYGHLGVGWSLAGTNFPGGMLRLLFAFSAGLLMSRVFKPVHIRGAFWLCSLAVVVLLCMPHVGGAERLWLNGLYDSVCVILIFPLLVWLGASGKATDSGTRRVCKFCGDISYPVYVVHYPFMYLFYAWLWGGEEKIPFAEAWPYALLVFFGSIALTYLILKVYDEPVRRWLARRFLKQKPRS